MPKPGLWGVLSFGTSDAEVQPIWYFRTATHHDLCSHFPGAIVMLTDVGLREVGRTRLGKMPAGRKVMLA